MVNDEGEEGEEYDDSSHWGLCPQTPMRGREGFRGLKVSREPSPAREHRARSTMKGGRFRPSRSLMHPLSIHARGLGAQRGESGNEQNALDHIAPFVKHGVNAFA
jgi:hypothetical protein